MGLTCVSCNPRGRRHPRRSALPPRERRLIAPPLALSVGPPPQPLRRRHRGLLRDRRSAARPTQTARWTSTSGSTRDPATARRAKRRLPVPDLHRGERRTSYFAEASANGGDVFLFTRQPLVSQDEDELVDLYDAREDGGMPAQNPSASTSDALGKLPSRAAARACQVARPSSQPFVRHRQPRAGRPRHAGPRYARSQEVESRSAKRPKRQAKQRHVTAPNAKPNTPATDCRAMITEDGMIVGCIAPRGELLRRTLCRERRSCWRSPCRACSPFLRAASLRRPAHRSARREARTAAPPRRRACTPMS